MSRCTADEASVDFQDSGIGIDPESIDEIFEPFHQGSDDIARLSGGIAVRRRRVLLVEDNEDADG
jgi:signal transduction histidine kinase